MPFHLDDLALFCRIAVLGSLLFRTLTPFVVPIIWATLLARFILAEPIDRRRLVGLGLGMAGLACLGLPMITGDGLSFGLLLVVLSQLAAELSLLMPSKSLKIVGSQD